MTNEKQQAFPISSLEGSITMSGLTKLEYITTILMQGILSNKEFAGNNMHPGLNVPLALEIAKEILSKANSNE